MLFDIFREKKKKQLIINAEKLETRVALMNKGLLEEYHIERTDNKNVAGSVYLGRIENYEQSLQAVFVDIGLEKNAFLHYWDLLPATYDQSEKILLERSKSGNNRRRNPRVSDKLQGYLQNYGKTRNRIDINNIQKIYPRGSDIFVQVSKGPIGTKGARVSANISIPGRYLVLLPFADHIGISKKIEDRVERKRLREILKELDIPEGMGLICRTFGEDKKAIFFKRDLDMLLERWNTAIENNKNLKSPCIILEEPSLIESTMRDFLTEDIDEIVVDDKETYNYLKNFLSKIVDAKMVSKVRLYDKPKPIFEYYAVEEQISAIFERRISLPGGGYICIDETEALIAIDVNSGTNKGKDQSETIVKTNLEACDEIGRQLRLRNIGGIIVIDFIDMRSMKDKDAVYKKMKQVLKDDWARLTVYPIGPAGLMELTRQRDTESLRERVYDSCPYCSGRGKVKSATSMSVEIQRDLNEIIRKYHREKNFSVRVIMHPSVLARMKNEDAAFLEAIEKKYGAQISFRGESSLHLEEFKLIDPATGIEYK